MSVRFGGLHWGKEGFFDFVSILGEMLSGIINGGIYETGGDAVSARDSSSIKEELGEWKRKLRMFLVRCLGTIFISSFHIIFDTFYGLHPPLQPNLEVPGTGRFTRVVLIRVGSKAGIS